MREIRQRELKDCGVTCVSYMIQYYGGYVPMEKLREDTNTTKKGTTAFHLIETLKKYQFDSFGKKMEYHDLKYAFFPAIVHVNLKNGFQHFMVLEKVTQNYVIVMDPAYGKRKIGRTEFLNIWTRVILFAIPKNKIPKIPKEKSVLVSLWEILKIEHKLVWTIVLLSFLVSFLTIILNLYFKIGLSKVGVISKESLSLFFAIFLFFLLFKLLFSFLKQYFTVYLDKNIETGYLYVFLKHLFRLPLKKLNTYHEGDILTRIEEAEEVKDLFESICITFFLDFLLGVCSLIVLFWINLKLTILLLIGMSCYFFFGFFFSRFYYRIICEGMEEARRWKECLTENIALLSPGKHLNRMSYLLHSLENGLCEKTLTHFHLQMKLNLYQFFHENFWEIFFFFLTTMGIILIGDGKLTILDFVMFQNLYFYFVRPFQEISDISPKFYYMKGIISKISETLDLKEEELVEKENSLRKCSISVQDLSFSYSGYPCFEHISLKIEDGAHVLLQGASGSGKSTFCKILQRELMDYQGKILINHKNLKDYSLSDIRSSMVYLSQKENLLHATIKENILFGSPENERFLKVCQICEIESIVESRPFRYETSISNEEVSGGERQRILLARTLMKEVSLYLLDECLSEVEDFLEQQILIQLHKFLEKKTLIYISHKKTNESFEEVIQFGRI